VQGIYDLQIVYLVCIMLQLFCGYSLLHVMLFPIFNVLCFYTSIFTMGAVPSMVVFCSSLTLCFTVMLLRYFLNDFEMVPVIIIIIIIITITFY